LAYFGFDMIVKFSALVLSYFTFFAEILAVLIIS